MSFSTGPQITLPLAQPIGRQQSGNTNHRYFPGGYALYRTLAAADASAAAVADVIDINTGSRYGDLQTIDVLVNGAAGCALSLYKNVAGVDYLVASIAATAHANQNVTFSNLLAAVYKIVATAVGDDNTQLIIAASK